MEEPRMMNRNIKITFRLNDAERARFKKRVKKSGLSQESYLRHIINGLAPTEKPPPDFHAMMGELRSIGNSLGQVAQKAHALNALDAKRYDESAAMLDRAIVDIMNAVMLPRKLE
jgi:hypothetical protein